MELIAMKTAGDRQPGALPGEIGGKGLFTRELEAALLEGKIDLCVHSYKDLPVPEHPELPVLAVGPREDARDALVFPLDKPGGDRELPLGSSSRRRILQLREIYPDWRTEPIRGNILTRIHKLDEGRFGGLVLAAAGLRRLELWRRAGRVFSLKEMLPAAGQGIIAIQGRRGDAHPCLEGVNNQEAWIASRAERAFLEELGDGCSAPSAAHAVVSGEAITLWAWRADASGHSRRGKMTGRREEAASLGRKLAKNLGGELANGG
jgi:hydroxymethylbilane synthase